MNRFSRKIRQTTVVPHKDVNHLHLKPRDAMDCSKWREIVRGNWSDSSSDSDAVAEYKLNISAAILPGLTWIKGCLFVLCFIYNATGVSI